MYDLDETEAKRTGPMRRATDPLRGAPPVGRWVLWHGDQAGAVLRLAQDLGREATAEERSTVVLPEGFPAPLEAFAPAWVLQVEAGRFLVRRDESGEYTSCYVGGLG